MNSKLLSYGEELIEFSGVKVHPDGYVTLCLTLGSKPFTRIIKMDFLVIDCPSAYNIIFGRPTLNKLGAIVSLALLTMKFLNDDGKIIIIKVDPMVT